MKWLWCAALLVAARAVGAFAKYVDCNSDAAVFRSDEFPITPYMKNPCDYYIQYSLRIPAGCCTSGRLAPRVKTYTDWLIDTNAGSCNDEAMCGGVGTSSRDAIVVECSNASVRAAVDECTASHAWLEGTRDNCLFVQMVSTCSPPGCCDVYYERSYAKFLLSKFELQTGLAVGAVRSNSLWVG